MSHGMSRLRGRCKWYKDRHGYLEPLGRGAWDACGGQDVLVYEADVEGGTLPFKGCIVDFTPRVNARSQVQAGRACVMLDRMNPTALAEAQRERLTAATQRQCDRLGRAAQRLVAQFRPPSYVEQPYDTLPLLCASTAFALRLHCLCSAPPLPSRHCRCSTPPLPLAAESQRRRVTPRVVALRKQFLNAVVFKDHSATPDYSVSQSGEASRRRDCNSTDIPSPSVLNTC